MMLLIILSSFLVALSSADMTEKEAKSFLHHFGYYNPFAYDGRSDISTSLKMYQNFFGLKETGVLDEATKKTMAQPRCGFPDILPGTNAFYATNSKWSSNQITYSYNNLGDLNELNAASKEWAVRKAFGLWASKSPLHFTKVSNGGNIKIGWYGKQHPGYWEPKFGGAWGVLAHAYFPYDGRLHFDEAETWVVNGNGNGPDLVELAAHEIGHAIGIKHSNVQGTVMWPNYLKYRPNLQLHWDDVNAVRSLYGTGVGSVDGEAPGGGVVAPTNPPPSNCKDTGKFCYYHVPRGDCKNNQEVRNKCPKGCGLCN